MPVNTPLSNDMTEYFSQQLSTVSSSESTQVYYMIESIIDNVISVVVHSIVYNPGLPIILNGLKFERYNINLPVFK